MQSLDIISINLWQMLISLCNLVILFLILKRFLYKPVLKVIDERKALLNAQYENAAAAEAEASSQKALWQNKVSAVNAEADAILKKAAEDAEKRSRSIIEKGQSEAERIVKQAEADAVLERKKAENDMKKEIVDVSVELSQKILEREIKAKDHRTLIEQFISEIGDVNANTDSKNG